MKKLTILLTAAFTLGLAGASACDGDGGANACERAGQRLVDRMEECGADFEEGGEGETVECTDALAQQASCSADCAEAAPCDVITLDYDLTDPPQEAVDYGECLQACQ